ncbi:MAG: energy transducer TonB [Bacillota bacterium]
MLKNTRPSGSRSDNPLLQKKISPIPGKSEDNPAPEDKNLGTGTDMLVRGSAPTYPKEAQNLNLTGEVVLKVTVIKGAAQEISILISSGVKMLDEHAKKTIEKQWQFKEEFFPYAVRISLQFTQNDVILTFLDAKKI